MDITPVTKVLNSDQLTIELIAPHHIGLVCSLPDERALVMTLCGHSH